MAQQNFEVVYKVRIGCHTENISAVLLNLNNQGFADLDLGSRYNRNLSIDQNTMILSVLQPCHSL